MTSTGPGEVALDGTKLEVRVVPRSGRSQIVRVGDGTLKAYVTAPPERGKANQAAISLLADLLGVAKSRIRIMRGHRSRDKVALVEGVSTPSVMARLKLEAVSSGDSE